MECDVNLAESAVNLTDSADELSTSNSACGPIDVEVLVQQHR